MNEKQDSTSTDQSNLEILPPSALEAITRGEIDIQIRTAHQYPRSIEMFKKRAIAMACIDIETAESCLYARPVGKNQDGTMKVVEGMSVRMAEIVGACYGNLRVGAIIVDQQPSYVKARGVAHDLETNFASSSDVLESTVKSDGKTPYDARMRVTLAKAAVAKARRDATFQVVPRALARPIERAVRDLLSNDKIQTFTERRDGVVRWITEKLNIDPKRVWAMLEIKGQDDLQQEHLDLLAGIKTALKEQDTTIDEAFPQIQKRAPKPGETPATDPKPDDKPKPDAKPQRPADASQESNEEQSPFSATPAKDLSQPKGGAKHEVNADKPGESQSSPPSTTPPADGGLTDEEKADIEKKDALLLALREDQAKNGWADAQIVAILKDGFGFPKEAEELEDCEVKFLEMVVKALSGLNKAIIKRYGK